MISAAVRRNALYSAIFSAGLGSGVGGAEAMRASANFSTEQVLTAGLYAHIAGDALQVARAVSIYQDIEDDVLPEDSVTVGDLPAYLSARLDYSDVQHAAIGQQFVVVIADTISDAITAGTIPADANVELEAFMAACREVLESYRGPLVLPPDAIDPSPRQRSEEQLGA